MLSILREKAVLTLLVLVALGAGIGTGHNRALDRGSPFVVTDAASLVLRPSATAFHLVGVAASTAVRVARPRRLLLKENADLRAEVVRLRRQNAILTEAAQENERLRAALGLKQSSRVEMVASEVISRTESTWFDTAAIDKGSRAGIRKGWPVITPDWRLVGQILETDAFSSRFVALTDANSAVGAMVQRSRSSGILQGQAGDYLLLSYLSRDADVKVGDIVVSSGMGQMIPKGLIIGRVVRVVRSEVMGNARALVRPSIRMDQIEQVFVIKPGQSVRQ